MALEQGWEGLVGLTRDGGEAPQAVEPRGPEPSPQEPAAEPSREPAADASGAEPPEERVELAPEPRRPEPRPEPPASCPPPPSKEPVDGLVKTWKELDIKGPALAATLPRCKWLGFRFVAAATMELQVDVTGLNRAGNYALQAHHPKRINGVAQEPPLQTGSSGLNEYISFKFTVPQSGELGALLLGLSVNADTPVKIHVFCTKNCHLEATRFPIALLHGFAGTDKYFGFLDYYYQVKPHLQKHGFLAFTPKVPPVANSKDRVLSLKKQIDAIFAQTGARKLNLIAHSQGGVDSRLLISHHKYGPKIASLTTISTPHRGIPIPNLLIPPSQELGEANMKKYNQQYPNDPQVKYFSWAGVSCGFLDRACRKKYKDETVDALLLGTYNALKAVRGANDGIVPVSSARWGTFLGELPADHFDEIGQVADRNNKSFNHKQFFLDEARRLEKIQF